jgi:hypothetical protein
MGASFALERLVFDPSSPGDGPNIGSYLRAGSDGDLLTSTLLGGTKESLDVNIAGSDVQFDVTLDLDDPVADDAPDTENPLKVGSRAHLQSAVLAALSANGDKADQLSDIYRRVWVTSAPNVGWSSAAGTTDATPDTAAQIDGTKQAGRQYIVIQNLDDKTIVIGASGVTTGTGFSIGKGSSASFDVGEGIDVYAVSAAASQAFSMQQVG